MPATIRNQLHGTIKSIVSDKVMSEILVDTAAGTVTVNGKPAAYTADVSQIVNVNGVVYQEAFGRWWAWDGTGWVGVSGDPTQATVTVTTVSYTHLDVYKRQGRYSAISIMTSARTASRC